MSTTAFFINVDPNNETITYMRQHLLTGKQLREMFEKNDIEGLKKVIQCFEDLKEEAFDIDENAYATFRDKLNYLEFRKGYIQKYGFIAHVQRTRIRNPHYLESRLGKVNYWLMVEPENEFAQTAHQHIFQLYKQKMNV